MDFCSILHGLQIAEYSNQLREMSDRYVFINCGKIVGHMKNEKKYKAECHEDPLEQYYFEVCKNV